MAWFKNTLIGRPEHLIPLIEASIIAIDSKYLGESSVVQIELVNQSSVEFTLENRSPYSMHSDSDILTLKPGKNSIKVKTLERLDSFELKFGVLNGVTAPKTHPEIVLKVGNRE